MRNTKLINFVTILFFLFFIKHVHTWKIGANRACFHHLALLCLSTYHPKDLNHNEWKLVAQTHNYKHQASGFIYIGKRTKVIVVGFPGTRTTLNWKYNAMQKLVRYSNCLDCRGCRIYQGLSLYLKSIAKSLDKKLRKVLRKYRGYPIVVTGHSSGGAFSTLYANRIRNKFLRKVKLITFGGPRTGNKQFARYTNRKLGLRNIYRVIFLLDPACFVPELFKGYWHIGDGPYQYVSYTKFIKRKVVDYQIAPVIRTKSKSPADQLRSVKGWKYHFAYFKIR